MSDAITMVNPTTPIVGKIVAKKISHPVSAARVQRSEISSTGIKTHVPITPAKTIAFDKPIGFGKA